MLGVLPGVIGTLQANEAIKLLLGIGDPLVGRLLLYDALERPFTELKLRRDPDCPVCGADADDHRVHRLRGVLPGRRRAHAAGRAVAIRRMSTRPTSPTRQVTS